MLLGTVLLTLFGCSYYNSTYKGSTAYAVVPEGVKIKSKNSGRSDYKKNGEQYYYYSYNFKWVLEDGTTKEVSWHSQESANPTMLEAGSYVKGEVSDKRVTKGPNAVSEGDIPAKVLEKLR